MDLPQPGRASVGARGRLTVRLEDASDGVRVQLCEPGQPGDDDPPCLLRAGYDVSNLLHTLSWRAAIPPGTAFNYALRRNAVYEVVRDFTDHYGTNFAAGTRLTFVQRNYLPYHGGHTLQFREAAVYLQDDDDTCRNFAQYFAVAARQ